MVGVFNASTSFWAFTIWAFSAYAFPAYLIVINILLFFAVYKKKLVSLLSKATKLSVLTNLACALYPFRASSIKIEFPLTRKRRFAGDISTVVGVQIPPVHYDKLKCRSNDFVMVVCSF
jgi:hypothetical protein